MECGDLSPLLLRARSIEQEHGHFAVCILTHSRFESKAATSRRTPNRTVLDPLCILTRSRFESKAATSRRTPNRTMIDPPCILTRSRFQSKRRRVAALQDWAEMTFCLNS